MQVFKKASLIIFWILFAHAGFAEEFSTTNVQLLYGQGFTDRYYGFNTRNEKMAVVTLEHFGTWSLGDNFFFADFLHGDFVDFEGNLTGLRNIIYSEWVTRLSIPRLANQKWKTGFIQDIYLAAQFDRGGDGFWANMLGVGLDLKIPGFDSFGLNLLYRKDRFNQPTYQFTPFWSTSKMFKSMALYFEGYFDVTGTDFDGIDLNGQPQWLLGFNSEKTKILNNCKIGIEWYFHKNDHISVQVPQIVLKWIW
jgi:nucleoside-specific outer membrane channel protein Tsx